MPTPLFHAVVIGLGALIAIIPALSCTASVLQFAPLPPHNREFVRFLLFAIGFFGSSLWLAFVVALVVLLFASNARQNLVVPRWLIAGLLILSAVSVPVGMRIMDLRMHGVRRVIQNAEPLIRAVESYRAATGEYPRDLKDLVPVYIKAIPYTGAVGYPDFKYQRAAEDSPVKTYEIYVNTSVGGFNFDKLVYWPEQNYPDYMYGGEIERVGAWAYVYE